VDKAQFPEKLRFLFHPAPYKIAHGGRGGLKSWSFARALELQGINRPLRILCAREFQKSIDASVHQLLKDQIQRLGIGSKYEVLEQKIYGLTNGARNGTEFLFTGLSTHTVETIKSYEGIDICWVEEGQTITERSWTILIPTIRKETFSEEAYEVLRKRAVDETNGFPQGLLAAEIEAAFLGQSQTIIRDLVAGNMTPQVESMASACPELWVSFNPYLETDPTYQRFVVNPPPGAIVQKMSWRDSPWHNKTMEAKRLHDKKTKPKEYANIWEGECLAAVEGAIFFDELQAMKRDQRIRNVPNDPMLKSHVVIDLGFGDAMAVGVVQKMTSEIRIPWYREFTREKLSKISGDLKALGWNWGKVWLPHADGFSKTSKGQDSAEEIMQKQGWTVARKGKLDDPGEVSALGVEEGIRVARERFPRYYWDETNCKRLVECAARYRRSINQVTMTAGAPLHDDWCHGGDFIRYVAINVDQMTNDTEKPRPWGVPRVPLDEGVGY